MASLERVLELTFKSNEEDDDLLSDQYDWSLPRSFQQKRHLEKIEGTEASPQTWRMKERMKTVSVALVICLNVGVDPPGILKTQPCARLECWVDPLSMSPSKALETIGQTLQKQYERWQPRARYKTSLDPTVDEVKKLCTSLRRNAKDERVLFHYNGHGVPQPTNNGEIWVFNRNYTQYIPLSIYDLQTWMGSPSIYVYDCSNAGLIIKSFHSFVEQHEKEYEELCAKSPALTNTSPPNFSNCIQLAACSESQILPMNPDLPADLFTACLTTPIRIALKWFILNNKDKLVPKISVDMIEKVPGQLNDRRTMLGELNWIFTAITDTIAWNVLPRHLFQKLFRQDLLVASLFRNFLLAERIMRSYDCSPTSSPKLPSTSQHPMWAAWDFALDLCLSQLPGVLEELSTTGDIPPHIPSPFFEEQLTAFQVWLELGSEKRTPPEQLPIVLQVLLSQVHRVRALELLGRFLDLGYWAVNLALSVGIFPYVLKLLQSSAKELRPLLVFIWAKILAVDHTCQTDLVRDGSHKYFITIIGDSSLPYEIRTLAVFVLTNIVRNYRPGQQAALQASSIATCLLALDEPSPSLRRWTCICLGLTWADFSSARWVGVRDSAHEKICSLLDDPDPEVRAAGVFALSTFINTTQERTEHANSIDHQVAMSLLKLCSEEASGLVRQEIIVGLHNFMLVFENHFIAFEQQNIINHELNSPSSTSSAGGMRRISSQTRMKILNNAAHGNNPLATVTGAESLHNTNLQDSMRRVASSSSLSSLMTTFSPGVINAKTPGGHYAKVYAAMVSFERDPYPGVALLAKTVLEHVRSKARDLMNRGSLAPSTPVRNPSTVQLSIPTPTITTPVSSVAGTPTTTQSLIQSSPSSETNSHLTGSLNALNTSTTICPLIGTKYIDWCWDLMSRPTIPELGLCVPVHDTQDPVHHTREWRYLRNTKIRRDCFRRHKSFPGKIDEQIFSSRSMGSTPSSSTVSSPSFTYNTTMSPSIIKLHPYERLLLGSDNSSTWSLYELGESQRIIGKYENAFDSRITSLGWINPHDESLVMIGADDGSLRLWKPNYENKSQRPKLISSFKAVSEIGSLTKSSKFFGLLTKWDQEKERLYATGDSKMVRIWDLKTELRVGDWPTGHDCCVTFIDINRCEPNLVLLGLEEGSVRLLDTRLPPAESGLITWRDFGESTWMVGGGLRHDRTIIAGAANGKIKFIDLRTKSVTKTVESGSDMTAFAVHPNLPYFASGSLSHTVSIYGFMGLNAFISNQIKEGLFISGRMGTVAALDFHDFKPIVATADSYSINVYKSKSWGI